MESATVVITSGYAAGEDVLTFINTANITGNLVGNTLTATGHATLAEYETFLESRAVSKHQQRSLGERPHRHLHRQRRFGEQRPGHRDDSRRRASTDEPTLSGDLAQRASPRTAPRLTFIQPRRSQSTGQTSGGSSSPSPTWPAPAPPKPADRRHHGRGHQRQSPSSLRPGMTAPSHSPAARDRTVRHHRHPRWTATWSTACLWRHRRRSRQRQRDVTVTRCATTARWRRHTHHRLSSRGRRQSRPSTTSRP